MDTLVINIRNGGRPRGCRSLKQCRLCPCLRTLLYCEVESLTVTKMLVESDEKKKTEKYGTKEILVE